MWREDLLFGERIAVELPHFTGSKSSCGGDKSGKYSLEVDRCRAVEGKRGESHLELSEIKQLTKKFQVECVTQKIMAEIGFDRVSRHQPPPRKLQLLHILHRTQHDEPKPIAPL